MEATITELKTTYGKMSDDALIKLASQEAAFLREEAVETIFEEMGKRNIPFEVYKAMYNQITPPTPELIAHYVEFLRNQACPYCNTTNEKLNASVKATAYSFLVMGFYSQTLVIGCPKCLDLAHQKANIYTALLGWWGLPFGLYRPFQAFIVNTKNRKLNHQETASDFFFHFTQRNLGKIQVNENQPNELRLILQNAGLINGENLG